LSFLEDVTPPATLAAYKKAAETRADVRVLEYILGWPGVLEWWLAVGAPVLRKARRPLPPFPPNRLREITAEPQLPIFLWTGLVDTHLVMRLFDQHRPGERREPVRILDLGCGCGRMTRHLGMRPDRWAVSGCDVNARHVRWCQRKLRTVHTSHTSAAPPTGYTDGQFDLVFSFSVFTHLAESRAAEWVAEIARILAPAGLFIATTHGIAALETIQRSAIHQTKFFMTGAMAAEVRERFGDDPYRFFPYPPAISQRAQAGDDYGNAFIHPEYIQREWGRRLTVLQHLPGGMRGWQDVVVMGQR
jgi:SAM-dependent methyltransferase